MKPSEQALDALADHIATYRPETCSAVHVRRGDYAEEWRGHGMLPAEWYLRVWPRGRVLVFSDEPEWCEHHLPGEVVHSEDWMDLILMSMCQEFTISNSSFAWWAAWTSGKHTFAPTPWFPGHVYNLYPDHWTMVPR